jgi:hypothetical protein
VLSRLIVSKRVNELSGKKDVNQNSDDSIVNDESFA